MRTHTGMWSILNFGLVASSDLEGLQGSLPSPTVETTLVSPCPWFHCQQFRLAVATCSLKELSKNSRNKQFLSFKLQAVLSSVMKSRAFLPHPTRDVSASFVQSILAACAPCLEVTE